MRTHREIDVFAREESPEILANYLQVLILLFVVVLSLSHDLVLECIPEIEQLNHIFRCLFEHLNASL